MKSNFNKKNILKKNCKILLGPKYNIIECKYKKNTKKSRFLKVVFYPQTEATERASKVFSLSSARRSSRPNVQNNFSS